MLTFGSGADTVQNAGKIDGNISLGAGDNALMNNAGGSIAGTIAALSGNNTITNAGLITGNSVLGDGLNKITNDGRIFGNVTIGDGGNSLTNNSPGIIKGLLTFGAGDNTVGNSGQIIGNIAFGGGNNAITNNAGATIQGSIFALNGNNMIGNAGTVTGNTLLGDGQNKITNDGSIAGNVTAGGGGNSLVNNVTGYIKGLLTFGLGADTVQNAGKIEGNVALGGGDNKLTVVKGGTIAGNVSSSGTGSTTISNAGTFTGNVDLRGNGANALSNLDGGVVNSLSSLYLGTGNTFTNSGTLSPGGLGTIQTTTITGNYVQTSTGKLVIDINEKAKEKSDSLIVTGTAKLSGTIVANVLDFNQVVKSEYKIVTAAGGITNNGISPNPSTFKTVDSIGYDFGAETRNGTDLFLTAQKQGTLADIANKAIAASGATSGSAQSANLGSVGGALAQAETTGNTALAPIINAVRLQADAKAAADTLNRLIPQNQGGQSSSTTSAGTAFGNAMLSCAERDGEYAYTREGKCYYAKATVRRLDREATSGGAGVKEDGVEFMGGVQVALWDHVRLGFALGYESTRSDSFDLSQKLGQTSGSRTSAGIVIKDQWGPVNAYLNLGGSFGSYDHQRFVNLAGIGGTATATQDVVSGISRLRLSYLNDKGVWYWKPLIDFGATYINAGGYTEQNAGAANLRVTGFDKWMLSVMPGIEFGGQMRDANDTIYRPYVRLGATFFDNQSYSVTANFDSAPVGLAPFIVTNKLDSVFGDVEVGVHVLTLSGFNVRLNYEGRFGEHSMQNAGTVKATLPLQ